MDVKSDKVLTSTSENCTGAGEVGHIGSVSQDLSSAVNISKFYPEVFPGGLHETEPDVQSKEIWFGNKFCIQRILAVCGMLATVIFGVLITDIINDFLEITSVISDGNCFADLMSKMEVLKEIQHTRDHNYLEALTSCSDTQSSDTTFFRNNVTSYNTSVFTCVTNFGGSLYYFTCKSLIRNNLEIFTNLSRVSVPAISGHASEFDVLTSLIYDCYDFAHYLRWTTAATYSLLLEILSSVYEELILCAPLTNKANISNACQKSLGSSMSEFSTRHIIVASKIRASMSRLMWLTGRGGANSSSWNLPGIIEFYANATATCSSGTASYSKMYLDRQEVLSYMWELIHLTNNRTASVRATHMEERARRVILETVITLVGVCTGVIVSLRVRETGRWIWRQTHALELKTEALGKERKLTVNLLYQMLPQVVADKLRSGQTVEAESFDSASIYFSDIVGFTAISSRCTPMQVVDLLNSLYSTFDHRIDTYDVYKVETIGDAYMVASGVPIRNGSKHASEIATMSIDLLAAIKQIRAPMIDEGTLQIRIGIHTGTCVAGVVGLKMPRYCLFGDTVNTASRMESTGEPMRIHCSQAMYEMLTHLRLFTFVPRGQVEIKGKGVMATFWLTGRADMGESNESMTCLWRPQKERGLIQ